MTEVILFGGTTEGRLLAAALRAKALPALVCVATEYGESLLEEGGSLSIRRGRLETGEMADLFRQRKPRLVIDATHPFAAVVSENIRAACRAAGTQYLRVLRADSSEEEGDGEQLERFSDLEDLIGWLNEQPGIIFSTLGAKEAERLSRIRGSAERVWLRILPDPAGLAACQAAGFLARRIICMQGPFSRELNMAMFGAAGADILITKESGRTGGYPEKIAAAKACGLKIGVWSRPRESRGLAAEEIIRRIGEGTL